MEIRALRDGQQVVLKLDFHSYVHRIEDSIAGDLTAQSAYVVIVNNEVTRLFAEHALAPFVVLADTMAAQARGDDYTPRNSWRTYDLVSDSRWRGRWSSNEILEGVEAMNLRAALFYDADKKRYILAEDLDLYLTEGREEGDGDANFGNINSLAPNPN